MEETNFYPITEAFFNNSVLLHAIGSCSAVKTNQCLSSGAAQAYSSGARQISPKPARMGEASGYMFTGTSQKTYFSSFNLFQKVKLSYILDSLHVK